MNENYQLKQNAHFMSNIVALSNRIIARWKILRTVSVIQIAFGSCIALYAAAQLEKASNGNMAFPWLSVGVGVALVISGVYAYLRAQSKVEVRKKLVARIESRDHHFMAKFHRTEREHMILPHDITLQPIDCGATKYNLPFYVQSLDLIRVNQKPYVVFVMTHKDRRGIPVQIIEASYGTFVFNGSEYKVRMDNGVSFDLKIEGTDVKTADFVNALGKLDKIEEPASVVA